LAFNKIMHIHFGQIVIGFLAITSGLLLRKQARQEQDKEKQKQLSKVSLALTIIGWAFIIAQPAIWLGFHGY
jgi:hypothetical protein